MPKIPTRTPCSRLSEAYRGANLAALGVALYGLALPFLMPLFERWAPLLVPRCSAQVLFNKPCPLCGVTRGLGALARGEMGQAVAWNPLVVPIAAFLALELAFRATMLLSKRAQIYERRLARPDLTIHAALAAAYLAYSAAFILGWR